MLLATAAGPALQDVITTVYCSKQTGSSSTEKPSPIISSFLELGRRKLSMQPKFVAAKMADMKTWKAFVNGLLGFITLGIYTPLERSNMCSQ